MRPRKFEIGAKVRVWCEIISESLPISRKEYFYVHHIFTPSFALLPATSRWAQATRYIRIPETRLGLPFLQLARAPGLWRLAGLSIQGAGDHKAQSRQIA